MLTATDNTTELDLTELVDMQSEPGCEHNEHPTGSFGHSGPAWGVIQRIAPCACYPRIAYLVCKGGWDHAGLVGIMCKAGCGRRYRREEAWRLVQVL